MGKLIAEYKGKDLREKSWKMLNFNKDGDMIIQTFSTKEGKKVKVMTKFYTYEDAFGNKEIMFQEAYEI